MEGTRLSMDSMGLSDMNYNQKSAENLLYSKDNTLSKILNAKQNIQHVNRPWTKQSPFQTT